MQKRKIKFETKLTEKFLDLKSTNVIIEHLEEQIELREMPIEEHIKKLLRK